LAAVTGIGKKGSYVRLYGKFLLGLQYKNVVVMKKEIEALLAGGPINAPLKKIRLRWDDTTRLPGFVMSVNQTICAKS
jgi:hypothetical protein